MDNKLAFLYYWVVFVLVSYFDAFCEYHFAELQLNWSVNFVVMLVLISNELGF